MLENKTYCKNCDSELNDAYCPKCGQRGVIHKVTFKETFQDLADSMFSLSAPLWITLKLLVINPGKLLREYLNGKRKRYYKPVTFFILATIAYLVVKSLLQFNPMVDAPPPANDKIDTTLFFEAGRYMFMHIDKILFFFVLSLALSLKLFFYRKNSLAEYVAISFYLLGVYTLMGIINMLVYTFLTPDYLYLSILFMLFYFVWALVNYFQKNKLLVLLKGVITYIVGFLLYFVMGFSFSLVIVLLSK